MSKTSTDQADRFKEAAREVEADQTDDALDRVMGKLDLRKKPGPIRKDQASSEKGS